MNTPSSAICSIQVLSGLDDDHPHWGRLAIVMNPHIQMLISSRSTLTDTPRNNVSSGPVAQPS